MAKGLQVKKILSERCNVSTNHRAAHRRGSNYREHEKILLAMPLDLAKSGGHEVCSRIRARLYCVCIANIRGVTTALSGKTGTAL